MYTLLSFNFVSVLVFTLRYYLQSNISFNYKDHKRIIYKDHKRWKNIFKNILIERLVAKVY